MALLNSHGRRIPHKIYKMLRFSEFDWGEWAKSSLLGAHKFNERFRIRIHHSLSLRIQDTSVQMAGYILKLC